MIKSSCYVRDRPAEESAKKKKPCIWPACWILDPRWSLQDRRCGSLLHTLVSKTGDTLSRELVESTTHVSWILDSIQRARTGSRHFQSLFGAFEAFDTFERQMQQLLWENPNPLLEDLVHTKTQAEHQMVTEKVQTRLPNVRYKWDHPLYKWGKIENNSSLEERLRSSLIQMRHWSMWPLLLWLWSSRTTTGLCYCETNWLENCWKYMIKILKWVLQFANVETSQTERARGKCPELR